MCFQNFLSGFFFCVRSSSEQKWDAEALVVLGWNMIRSRVKPYQICSRDHKSFKPEGKRNFALCLFWREARWPWKGQSEVLAGGFGSESKSLWVIACKQHQSVEFSTVVAGQSDELLMIQSRLKPIKIINHNAQLFNRISAQFFAFERHRWSRNRKWEAKFN